MSPIYLLVVIALGLKEAAGCDCPNAWTVFRDSCYFQGHDSFTFLDAERYCNHRHSHLVHINDATENAFIKSFLADLDYDKHWIGLTDQDIENIWQWYDTDEMATYTNWSPGQPDDGLDANCGAIWKHDQYNWIDQKCSERFRPLCEQPCLLDSGMEVVG